MSDFHGIIFAYKAYPELRELVNNRTAASLPVCGRYRLIDFALSSMRNAGIVDVGVIMQRDYQSLLDYLGSGKEWDMSRRSGGLHILPPFGLPVYHRGNYAGTIEALNAVGSYISDIPQKYVVLMLGNVFANIDLAAVCEQHKKSGAGITAICGNYQPDVIHHRYVTDASGRVTRILFDRKGSCEGIPSLEGYVINKDILLDLMDRCKAQDKHRFHQDAIAMYLDEGGKMMTYVHKTYARIIMDVDGYYASNEDALNPVNRAALFPADRPVRGKDTAIVSTYYGENSSCSNSLVADDCRIEGSIENCIIFPGVKIGEGAVLKRCIIMEDTEVGPGTQLEHVIADKEVSFSAGLTLLGSSKLPIVVPKKAEI